VAEIPNTLCDYRFIFSFSCIVHQFYAGTKIKTYITPI
jgi:hypothetical protein